MTYSNTYSSPSSPTNFNPFSGMGMRKGGRPSLFPGSGDGSTLNLDFTTGVLDSRLTFSRSSTATFVNSSGYVEWAGANLLPNSATLQGTGWYIGTNGVGGTVTVTNPFTATNPENGATCTRLVFGVAAAGGSPRLYYTTTAINPHTMFVWMRSNTPATNYTISLYQNDTWVDFTVTPTWTRFQTTRTSGTGLLGYFMLANNSTSVQPDILVWGAQLNPGSTAQTYYPTTTAAYHAPRFDYSPTNIGEPRGLLIEGQSVNLVTNSISMWNWGTGGVTKSQDTTVQDIFGQTGTSNNTAKVVKASGAGSQFHTLQAAIPSVPVAANTIVDVTVSVWVKMDGVNQPKFSIGILDTSGTPSFGATFGTKSPNGQSVSNDSVTMSSSSTAECDYTFGLVTGWVRCSISRRLNNTTGSLINWTTGLVLIYPDRFTASASTIYVCGAQVEIGLGASSLIPAGASQVTRNLDNCFMNDISALSYSTTNGTLFYESLTTKWNISSYPARIGFTKETGDYHCFGALTDIGGMLPNVRGPASTPLVIVTLPFALNTNTKCAWSFDAALSTAELKATINGGTIVNSATSALTVSETPTYFGLGQKGYDLYLPCGPVKRVKYWPTTLTDAQLQTLTTP